MNKLNNKKGISLIVLVITIIVMIVLAAAIILSLQSSGIIERSNEAKSDNDVASYKEMVSVAHAEWMLMNETEQQKNGGTFEKYAEVKLENAGMKVDEYIIDESGTVDVCVAKIGDVKYATLRDAVKAAVNEVETTIKVVNNIELTNVVAVTTNKNIILDLNGYTISSIGKAISNSGTLTIIDSSEKKTGSIKAVADKALYNEKYDINGDGIVGQEDMDKISEHFGVVIDETTSEEIRKCDTDENGGINVLDFSCFSNNTNDAYALFARDGILTIEGISKEKISGEPSAIYIALEDDEETYVTVEWK